MRPTRIGAGVGVGKSFRGTVEKLAVLLVVQKRAQVLVGGARRASCCSASRRPQACEEGMQRERTRLTGLKCSDVG